MPQIFAFLTAAFPGLGTAWAALGPIGQALVKLGGSLLLNVAAQALMPKPTIPGARISMRQPVMPRSIIYGRARVGGMIAFVQTTGGNNQQLHVVIVLASHRVKSIGAVYFDGEKALEANGTAAQSRYGSGNVEIQKRLGGNNQSAFSMDLDEWTAAHRLRGCAAIYLRMRFGRNRFPNGLPNITVDVEGKDTIYDPRTDTTGYSENAALCLADYMGLQVQGRDFGIGAQIGAPDGINEDALIEAANICDEEVELDGGGTEPRYTCNGVLTLDQTPKTIIEGMLSAMAGRVAWHGGQFHIHAGAYREPTVTLGPGDIMTGGITVATRMSMRDNFNGVRGQFVSPENDWQPDDFPAYESDAYADEDGGERKYRDIVLPFTISASMAQRLAKIELERVRRQQTVRLQGKLTAYRAVVGETVALDYPRWGYEDKPFEVHGVSLGVQEGEAGAVLSPELVLRETSPLVFDWEASEEQIYAAAPRTTLPSAFDIEPPGTPTVTEELYQTRDGTGVKALATIEWEEAESPFVDRYEVEARLLGEAWIPLGFTQGLFAEFRDIDPGTWEFRVRSVSLSGVTSDWASRTREILGLTAPPQQLQGLSIQTAGGLAILKWEPSPDLDVRIGGRIKIRHSALESPTWANSVSYDEVPGNDGVAVVALKPGTYLLRARDNSGNLGPVAMVSTKGAQALEFANISSLTEDPSFSGTKDNVETSGSNLTLTDIEQEGVYTFNTGFDFGSLRLVRLRSDIRVTALELAGTIDDRTDPIDTWADFDGTEGADTDVIVEARYTDDDPAGSPVWSDWARVDSNETETRGVQCRARLISRSEDYNVLVSRLRVHADEVA